MVPQPSLLLALVDLIDVIPIPPGEPRRGRRPRSLHDKRLADCAPTRCSLERVRYRPPTAATRCLGLLGDRRALARAPRSPRSEGATVHPPGDSPRRPTLPRSVHPPPPLGRRPHVALPAARRDGRMR